METLLTDPLITPDEVATLQLANIAAGFDSVTTNFGWRASRPSTWALDNWKKRTA